MVDGRRVRVPSLECEADSVRKRRMKREAEVRQIRNWRFNEFIDTRMISVRLPGWTVAQIEDVIFGRTDAHIL